MLKNNTGRPRVVNRDKAKKIAQARAIGLSWSEIERQFNVHKATARDAVNRYHSNGYEEDAEPAKLTSNKVSYADTASHLDDTKLPRWTFMPPRVNIALLSRRDSWHYKPE